jgi:site-specific DNA-methyltransferase (adenine-specific)
MTKPNYQLYQGDCLKVLPTLADESVDAVITDPPYSSGGLSSSARSAMPSKKYIQDNSKLQYPDFYGDNKDQRAYFHWSALWLGECFRIAKPGSPIIVFTDWRQLPITTDAVQAGGWTLRGNVVWDKTEAVRPQPGRFRNQCEYAIWGSKGDMPINRKVKVLPGVFRVIVKPKEKYHMTGKPVELMEKLIQITEPEGIILDPFAGSGSTGVAALSLGYSFIGIEQSKQYSAIAHERLEKSRKV